MAATDEMGTGAERGGSPTVLHVKLRQDGSGYPPYTTEELLATEVGDHLYRLETVPVFAFGLARGDTVRVHHYHDEPTLWVDELVAESGHSTVRVIPLGGSVSEEPRLLCEAFGCKTFTTLIDGLLAVDVPPDVSFEALRARLLEGRESRKWDFSVGVQATTPT